MNEPWESLPVVDAPEVADGEAWETLPVIAPRKRKHLTGASLEEAHPLYVPGEAEQQRASIKLAFEQASTKDASEAQQVLQVAQSLNVPTSAVRNLLPRFKETMAVVEGDPAKWQAANPELSRLMVGRPELGRAVVVDREIPALVRALRLAWEVMPPMDPISIAAGIYGDVRSLVRGEAEEAVAEKVVAMNRALASKRTVEEVDDEQARAFRENYSSLGLVSERVTEAYVGLEKAATMAQVGWARRMGGEPTELLQKAHDLRLKGRPRSLGEAEHFGGATLSEMATGTTSTAVIAGEGIKGAGAGAVIGGAAGLLATRTPAGFWRGAQLGAGWGGRAKLAEATFNVEMGDAYEQFLGERRDDGLPVTEPEAFGAAVAVGLANTGVELVSWEYMRRAFGPAGSVLRQGALEQVKAMLRTNPEFRRAAAFAAGKAWAGEGGEEGVQAAAQELGGFLLRSRGERLPMAKEVEAAKANIAASVEAGLVGGVPFAGLAFGVNVASSSWLRGRAQRADQLVDATLALAANPTVQVATKEFAQVITEGTAKSGVPVTAVHYDARAVLRYYQEQGLSDTEVDARVAEVAGPGLVEQLRTQAAVGGKLEVPLDVVLGKWGKDPIAAALKKDATTHPALPTPNEREAAGGDAAVELLAAELARGYLTRQALDTAASERWDAFEASLVQAKRPAGEAMTARVLWQRFETTLRHVAPEDAQRVFAAARVQFSLDPEVPVAPNASEVLTSIFLNEAPEARVTGHFLDSTTGALNERAAKRIAKTASQVAIVAIEGVKQQNDKVGGGHISGDAVYRAGAQALRRHLPPVALIAKVRGDFQVFNVAQAELDTALEAANKDPELQGFTLLGRAGADAAQAGQGLTEAKKAAETAGTRSPRGQVPKAAMAEADFRHLAALTGTPIGDELRTSLGDLDAEQAFLERFVEPATELLTKDGRDAYLKANPKDYWVAIDLNLLSAFNELLDEAGGNLILERFGQLMMRQGASDFVGTHVSGDEYSLHGNDLDALVRFVGELERVAEGAIVEWKEGVVVEGVTFGKGIGNDQDGAEQRLLGDKQRLLGEGRRAATPEGSRALAESRIARGSRAAQAAGEAHRAAAGLAGRDRGGPQRWTGPAGRRAVEAAHAPADRGGEAAGPEGLGLVEGARPPSRSPHTPEAMAEARDYVSRMRPDNAARFGAFLDFVERWNEGSMRPPPRETDEGLESILSAPEERRLADRYGVLDPELGYHFDLTTGRDTSPGAAGTAERRGPQSTYEREKAAERLADFNKNVRGWTTLKQSVAALGPALTPTETTRLYQEQPAEPASAAPLWFSQVARAVSAAKQAKNTPAAWWALVQKSPGVKAEELEWMGLKDWLDQQKGSITREQVQEYVHAHRVEVTEVAANDVVASASEEARRLYERGADWTGLTWTFNESFVNDDDGLVQANFDAGDAQGVLDDIAAVEAASEEVVGGEISDSEWITFVKDNTSSGLGEKLILATGVDDAGALATRALEYENKVTEAAEEARQAGEAALNALRDGDLAEALEHAERAESIERDYGDAPNWGPLAGYVRGLDELPTGAGFYSNYTLGGHEEGSYRELLFYAPSTPAEGFKAPHFESAGKGLLAHARVSTHTAKDGQPVLFIEEIQSDLHQAAREAGGFERRDKKQAFSERSVALLQAKRVFVQEAVDVDVQPDVARAAAEDLLEGRTAPATLSFALDTPLTPAILDSLRTRAAHLVAMGRAVAASGVDRRKDAAPAPRPPRAPFTATWEEFVFKRLVRLAADEGFTRLAWTTGEQQAERYKLATHATKVEWRPATKTLKATATNGAVKMLELKGPEELPAYIGAENALKLLAAEPQFDEGSDASHVLRGEDMVVGGEGMRVAYDQRLPSVARKLTKQRPEVQPLASAKEEVWTLDLPEELLARVKTEGQALFQPDDDGDKGFIDLPLAKDLQKVYRIFFTKSADFSTVVHESAHAFLEIFGDVAEAASAPQSVKDDWAKALKWLGVASRDELRSAQAAASAAGEAWKGPHETFARGFEAWLLKGEAPVKGLDGLFTRMKLWLSDIYKSVAELRVKLNPEIEGVFARLLATQEEIDQHAGRQGPRQFEDAAAAGVTAAQWAQDMAADVTDTIFATRKAELFALKDRLRETEAWWKEKHRAELDKALANYELLPARQAQLIIEGKTEFPGVPMVLDREAVTRVLGKKRVPGLVTTKKGGVSPDVPASMAGYATGEAMLQALASLPVKDTWAAREADEVMAREHPSVLENRDELRRLVADGLHEVAEKRILREWERLTNLNRTPRPLAVEALKRAAKRIADGTAVGRIATGNVLQQERAAAERAAQHGVKGEWEAALTAKQDQLLNVYLHRELAAAEEEREAFLSLAKDLGGLKSRKRIGKASTRYRDGIDAVLEALGLKPLEPGRGLGPSAVDAGVQELEADAATVVGDWAEMVPQLLGAQRVRDAKVGWKVLRLAEMRQVVAALKQFQSAARFRTSVLVGQKRAERADVVADMQKEALGGVGKKPPPGQRATDIASERLSRVWNAFDGYLVGIPDLVADLLGDRLLDSTTWQAIVQPMQDAKVKEHDLLTEVVAPIVKAFETMPAAVRSRFMEHVDGEALFPGHTERARVPRRRFEILMMAFNAGNSGNLQRLTDGRNITVDQVKAALDLLTAEEIAWVQTVLDQVETLREPSFELEERLTGMRPGAVEALPMQLRNGLLRGGYFPVVYQRDASQVGERQAAKTVAELMDPGYTRPGTSHGHLKARAEKVLEAAVALEPDAIYRHLASTVHDIAFREAVQSVGSLLLDPRVADLLKERLGPTKARLFLKWAQDVGVMRGSVDTEWGAFVLWIRSHLATAVLGWSLPTALGDLANLPAAVAATALKASHLAGALASVMAAPQRTYQDALELSGQLRFMRDHITKDFNREMKSLTARGPLAVGPLAWYRDHAFAFMEASQLATALPVWLGSYRQGLAEGQSEAQAVRFADDVLTQAFPSHSPVDQSAILRSKEYWGMATLFYGYLNVAYRGYHNIARPLFTEEFREASAGNRAAQIAKVAGSAMAFSLAFGVLAELLMGRGPEAGDEDEEGRRWPSWLLRKLLVAPLSVLPFEAGQLVEGVLLDRRTNPKGGPVGQMLSTVGEAWRAWADTDDGGKRFAATVRLLGLVTGVPVRPLLGPGRYWGEVALGERDVPSSVPEAVSGTVYGAREGQPTNVFTLFEEDQP